MIIIIIIIITMIIIIWWWHSVLLRYDNQLSIIQWSLVVQKRQKHKLTQQCVTLYELVCWHTMLPTVLQLRGTECLFLLRRLVSWRFHDWTFMNSQESTLCPCWWWHYANRYCMRNPQRLYPKLIFEQMCLDLVQRWTVWSGKSGLDFVHVKNLWYSPQWHQSSGKSDAI